MMTTIAWRAAAVMCAVLVIASCGSSGSNGANASPSAASTAMSGAMSETTATVPPGMKCETPIVWVNLRARTYHMPGDKYYGRTKHGEYLCQGDAEAHGFTMAGMPKQHTGHLEPSPTPT